MPGWVEHTPMEIWSSQLAVAIESMAMVGAKPDEISGIGITNQRETTIVWDKKTGQPVYPAIVWQCRRTAEFCEELKRRGLEERIRAATGLLIDAYFSGSKICDADGNSVDTASQQLVDATSLIGLCYQSILNGSAGCDKVSDGYLYGLSLDSDAMSALAAAIAPDIKAQNVTFSSGRISVRVSEQGELQSVNISCSGALHLILSDAPVSLSAVITPADRAFSIPQPALNALKQ